MNEKCSCKYYCLRSNNNFDCSELTESSCGIVVCEKEKAITNMSEFDNFLKSKVSTINEFKNSNSKSLHELEQRVINKDNSVTREEYDFVEALRKFNSDYQLFSGEPNFRLPFTLYTCRTAYDLFQAIETIINFIEMN